MSCTTLSQGCDNLVITLLVGNNLVTTLSPPYSYMVNNIITTLSPSCYNLVTILLQPCHHLVHCTQPCCSLVTILSQACTTLSFLYGYICNNGILFSKMYLATYVHSMIMFTLSTLCIYNCVCFVLYYYIL